MFSLQPLHTKLTTLDHTGSFSVLFLKSVTVNGIDSKWFTRAINSAGGEEGSSVDDIANLLNASALASS